MDKDLTGLERQVIEDSFYFYYPFEGVIGFPISQVGMIF